MGTTNHELLNMAKELKLSHPFDVVMKDELENRERKLHEYLIVNLQNSNQSGSHWVAIIRDDNKKYHYSSFGDDPSLEVQRYLGNNIITSTFKTQEFNETCCGPLALLVIFLYDRGVDFEDAVLFLVDAK